MGVAEVEQPGESGSAFAPLSGGFGVAYQSFTVCGNTDELMSTVLASSESGLLDRPGGVFIRRADLLKPEDVELLYSIARIQVDCDGLGLGNFLEFPHVEDSYSPKVAAPTVEAYAHDAGVSPQTTAVVPLEKTLSNSPVPGDGLMQFNGLGGFNAAGEYELRLTGDLLPPAPWINIPSICPPLRVVAFEERCFAEGWERRS